MKKNWLIRTKNKHILGPISKTKLQELFGLGQVKNDDKVCAGNGYWFKVQEKALVEKFVVNDEVQPFNPVSEVPQLLGETSNRYPSDDDLEYPSLATATDGSVMIPNDELKSQRKG